MRPKMRILGIDPGTLHTGWAVVDSQGTRLVPVDCGIISPPKKENLPTKLHVIHSALVDVVSKFVPAVVAVEDIFFAKYPNAALKLGHARGVALLAAASADLLVHEYPPAVVKRAVVGKGRADKQQVSLMVMRILGLRQSPGVDATDAFAVAIAHHMAARSSQALLTSPSPSRH